MIGYIPFIGEGVVQLLRGGSEIGPSTLTNFYSIHTGILPFCLIIIVIYHFWLIRKAGGLVRYQGDQTQETVRVRTVPHLIQREAAVGLVLLGLLFTFSALVDAPLADQANPGQSPNPAKAAWYFMGLQELLLHLHPSFAICIVPGLVILCFALIPFWQGAVLPPGRWFGGKRGRNLALWSSIGGFLAAVLLVVGDEKLFRLSEHVSNTRTWLTRGVLPLAAAVSLLVLFFLFLRRQSYSRAEAVMALVLVTIGLISGLTAIGIWFRGPGMTLSWPF